jgi:hypothetical protein
MSEGPSFPAYGTVLRVENNVTRVGGLLAEGEFMIEGSLQSVSYLSQDCSVNVLADGQGGEFVDWTMAFNVVYKPFGTVALYNIRNESTFVNVGGTDFVNGTRSIRLIHDGYGGLTEQSTNPTYSSSGVFYTDSAQVFSDYNGTNYAVGNAERQYRHDGNGGYTTELVNVVYHYQGYVVGSVSGNYYVNVGGTDYASGYYYNELLSDGMGGISGGSGSSGYTSSGTYITNYDGYNWYHNGSGGTYTESTGGEYNPYPSAGTTTGNGSSGTNYIYINGNNYANGSYSNTEYHDGSGGTYWSGSTSYEPYGYTFYSDSYSDEWGNWTYTYYNSDGNGGYYTSS